MLTMDIWADEKERAAFMKVIKSIWGFISTVLVIAVVVLAIALVGVRIIGLTPMTVLSGSMEPTYHVGSLVYVKKINPSEITEGMPITFVVNDDLVVATHRVIDIEKLESAMKAVVTEDMKPVMDEDGNPTFARVALEEPAYYFTTKGDANDAADGSPVYYKNVVGTPVFTIPYLGYVSSWLQTRKGMIMGGCIAMVLLMMTFIPDMIRKMDDEPKKTKADKETKKNAE